jgi:hypothetical protein
MSKELHQQYKNETGDYPTRLIEISELISDGIISNYEEIPYVAWLEWKLESTPKLCVGDIVPSDGRYLVMSKL